MDDKKSASSPNVIWMFGDQHRAQALSVMEDPNVQTPNIDRLAVSSRTGIAGSPLCSPFRGSLLTSQYPHRCIPGHDIALPDGMPTVATAFGHNDYQTAYIGKWHVDGATHRPSDTRPAFQYVNPNRMRTTTANTIAGCMVTMKTEHRLSPINFAAMKQMP